MPRIVLDTSISLPATLSPRGLSRKLLVLLAYGALNHQAGEHQIELDTLHHEAQKTGASLAGEGQSKAAADAASQRIAALRDLLPEDAPTNWLAVGSIALFDEYERKVREIGTRLNPTIRQSDVAPLRRQLESVCAMAVEPAELANTPALTRDRNDDPIVHTALLSDADYLVSDDHDIVPDGHEHHYEHDGHHTLAVTFNHLLSSHFEPAALNWGQIDGRWLIHAYPRASSQQSQRQPE